jgi:GNAT superfamily N-acetyltransferase
VADGEYSLEPLETLPSRAVAEVRRIYEEGFPPHQRADFAEVSDRRQDGELALALVHRDQPFSGQPCGFAMLRPLGPTGWIFLRYFVVEHHQRGQGLGGVLWDRLTARLGEDGFTLLVFDVDDPAEPGRGPDEVSIRSRRISFYERHGARLLPVSGYRAPDVAPHAASQDDEGADWTPMRLMTVTLAGNSTGLRPGPDGGRVRAIVDAVYRYRWQLDPGHPQLARVLINSE